MAFESFQLSRIDTGEATLRVRHGGAGPPLLLLHGYPETHMMWGKIADELARDFTVVAPDLRGYGESSKPVTTEDHEPYSKRAMARDVVALMAGLGFESFNVAGHDRGGRVAYRLALDRPEVVRKVSVLDIIPTADVWRLADRRFALGYWHWSFLAQAHPFPEHFIAADPVHFAFRIAQGATYFEPAAYADYVAALADPAVIHAMCEDYRAGATYDVAADEADRGVKKIAAPTQVLWGAKGAVGHWYDVLEVWRPWCEDLRGQAIEGAGHFLAEEKPAQTLAALRGFLLGG